MFWKRKEECVHAWYLADFQAISLDGLDIDDYFILRCEKCESKRYADDYTYGQLVRNKLVKEA